MCLFFRRYIIILYIGTNNNNITHFSELSFTGSNILFLNQNQYFKFPIPADRDVFSSTNIEN